MSAIAEDWWPTFSVSTGMISLPDAATIAKEQTADLLGRVLLIGITQISGEQERHFQTYGRVVEVDSVHGVTVACQGAHEGRMFTVPPDLTAFDRAQHASYRLRSTGETVDCPDFLVTFTIRSGAKPASTQQKFDA